MFTHLIWGPVRNTHACGSELSTTTAPPRQSRCPSHSGSSASLPRLTYWIFKIWCLGCWVGGTLGGGVADVWFVLRGFAGMKVTVGKLFVQSTRLVCLVLCQSLLDLGGGGEGGVVKVPYSLKMGRNKKTNGRLWQKPQSPLCQKSLNNKHKLKTYSSSETQWGWTSCNWTDKKKNLI